MLAQQDGILADVTALAAATDGLSLAYSSPRGVLSRPTKKLFGHARRFGLSMLNENKGLKNINYWARGRR